MDRLGRLGSALVISLVFIILITILIVGFATTAGLERKTVKSHFAKVQADLYSGMAVGVAASRITAATSQAGWWVSQPGRIALGTTGTTGGTVEFVSLTSGAAGSLEDPDLVVDLNPAALMHGGGLLTGDPGDRFRVRWIYVREDGSQIFDPATVPAPTGAPSPLVGRYAFWVDDFSTRLNLNAAASPLPPDRAASHPSLLALKVLDPSGPPHATWQADETALRNFREDALFETVGQAAAARDSSNLRAALAARKMDLTVHSHSPDLNVFGEPKIVLTTRTDRADGQPFFDILNTTGADPGVNANLNAGKYNDLFQTLYGYLARRDWPMDPGKSFVDKYGAQNCAQIVLNLIDYVRSAEAEKVIVEASRGTFSGTTFTFAGNVASVTGMMGNARRLLITQMGVWISESAPFQCRFRTEVFLPPSAGDAATEVDLLEGDRHMLNEIASPAFAASSTGNYQKIALYGSIEGGSGPTANRAKMRPGQFRTITMMFPAGGSTRPSGSVYLRSTIRIAGNANVGADIAPSLQVVSGTGQAAYLLDPPGTTWQNITSLSINDPVINKSRFDWTRQGANTFGTSTTFGASTLGQAASPTLLPQQDTDAAGLLTDVGFGFPAVKGSAKNPRGMVESIGELGRVHTGGKGTSAAGVPWRTLRIQPRLPADTALPDWALLDLFAVPKVARGIPDAAALGTPAGRRDAVVLSPEAGAVGGRINVNARLHPFADDTPPVTRTAPLRAALESAVAGFPVEEATAAAQHVAEGTLASGSSVGRWYGPSAFRSARLFLVPEQIAEIETVADAGEASEVKFRAALPFLTARSSVFCVFSVGQKITQSANGRIQVLGESRNQTLMERRNGVVQVVSTSELGL